MNQNMQNPTTKNKAKNTFMSPAIKATMVGKKKKKAKKGYNFAKAEKKLGMTY